MRHIHVESIVKVREKEQFLAELNRGEDVGSTVSSSARTRRAMDTAARSLDWRPRRAQDSASARDEQTQAEQCASSSLLRWLALPLLQRPAVRHVRNPP